MKNKLSVLSFTLILIFSTLCCVSQIKNNNLENKDILYQY